MPLYDSVCSLDIARRVIPWRDETVENMDDKMGMNYPCRFCGLPTHKLKEAGNCDWWGCDTLCCPGNQETRIVFDNNARFIEHQNTEGNTERMWKDFHPAQNPIVKAYQSEPLYPII